jgi:hypothetical protein
MPCAIPFDRSWRGFRYIGHQSVHYARQGFLIDRLKKSQRPAYERFYRVLSSEQGTHMREGILGDYQITIFGECVADRAMADGESEHRLGCHAKTEEEKESASLP